jgi:hypothetical protein
MSITEVRNRFHALIDEVENPLLLEKFFDIIKQTSKNKNSKLWNTLSASEKDEVLKAYEESKDENNLVAHEEVMNNYKKWRKK